LADEDFLYDKFPVLRNRIKGALYIISTKHPEAVFLQTIIFFQIVRIKGALCIINCYYTHPTVTSAEFLHVTL